MTNLYYEGGERMKKGKILSAIGCGGVLFTFLITQTSFSSANAFRWPFMLIGTLLCVIIIALGELIKIIEDKNEK